jgi:hypothetical protein
MEKQLKTVDGGTAVGIKETAEFIAFIATVAGIIAKNAIKKGSFLSIARDLVMTVFDAQVGIEGFNQIGSEIKDLNGEERTQLELAVRAAIIRQIGDTSKVDEVAGPLTVAAISIYQSIAILKSKDTLIS